MIIWLSQFCYSDLKTSFELTEPVSTASFKPTNLTPKGFAGGDCQYYPDWCLCKHPYLSFRYQTYGLVTISPWSSTITIIRKRTILFHRSAKGLSSYWDNNHLWINSASNIFLNFLYSANIRQTIKQNHPTTTTAAKNWKQRTQRNTGSKYYWTCSSLEVFIYIRCSGAFHSTFGLALEALSARSPAVMRLHSLLFIFFFVE